MNKIERMHKRLEFWKDQLDHATTAEEIGRCLNHIRSYENVMLKMEEENDYGIIPL